MNKIVTCMIILGLIMTNFISLSSYAKNNEENEPNGTVSITYLGKFNGCGYIYSSAVSWAGVLAGTGSLSATVFTADDIAFVEKNYYPPYSAVRYYLTFDTSNISGSATILTATLYLNKLSSVNTEGTDYYVTTYKTSFTYPLSTSSWTTVGDVKAGANANVDIYGSYPNGNKNEILYTSCINKGGYTQFVLKHGAEATAPSVGDVFEQQMLFMHNLQDVKLVVTMSLPTEPVANAGTDYSGYKGVVGFDGSASTTDYGITEFRWQFTYNSVQQTLYGVTNSFDFQIFGTYTVTLRVKDMYGQTDTDTKMVYVYNTDPIADAGSDQDGNKGVKTFDGSGSYDPDTSIASYTWTFTYNSLPQTLTGSQPTFDFQLAGVYIVTLTVADTDSATATDTMRMTIYNQLPIANAGSDQSGNKGIYNFNGGGSYDPDGTIIEYKWEFTYDTVLITLYDVTNSWDFQLAGVYTVTLMVTDNEYATATDQMIITIYNQLPIANAGADQYGYGVVVFDGSASYDPDGTITEYKWEFTYNLTSQTLYTVNPSFDFLISGIYIVQLTVTDNEGSTDVDFMTVYNDEIIAEAGNDIYTRTNQIVAFDGSSSYSAINIINYTWRFFYNSSNIEIYGVNPSFTFWVEGSYIVELTITNDYLMTDIDTMTVYVQNYPFSDADGEYYGYTNSTVDAYGWQSWDEGGTILNWTWTINSQNYYGENITINTVGMLSGSYLLTLKVTDNDGFSTWDNTTVYLQDYPIADAGSYQEGIGIMYFDGSGSIGKIINYTWSFIYNSVSEELYGVNPSFNFTLEGFYNITLTVTDGNYTHADVVMIYVRTPEANAGIDAIIPRGDYYLDGSSSSPDIVYWMWEFNHYGIPIVLNGVNPLFNFTELGMHTIKLTGTNIYGFSGFDWVNITVINTNPIADAGLDDSTTRLVPYTFDGSGSYDPDWGTIDNYTWTFMYPSLKTIYGMNPSYLFNDVIIIGAITVTLTVTDNDGGIDTDDMILTILNTNPVADAGSDQSGQKGTYFFTGTGSYDQDGGWITNYTWTFNYNGSVTLYNAITDFYFYVNGNYEVTLTVIDNDGGIDTDTMWINITWLNPVADAGVDQYAILLINFDGSNSYDVDGWIVNWTWTFTYNGSLITLYDEYPSFIFNITGIYNVLLNVTDNDGLYDTDNVIINIDFPMPVANAGNDQIGYRGTYHIDGGLSYHPNGTIIQYRWDFVYNGTPYTIYDIEFDFYFYTLGSYEITLNVTDSNFRYDEDKMYVTIIPALPVVMFGINPNNDYKGLKALDGTDSYAPFGWLVNYTWTITHDTTIEYFYDAYIIYNFTNNGNYTIKLNITDNDGYSSESSYVLKITWRYPTANVEYTFYTWTDIITYFSANGSWDEDGVIVNYTWVFEYNNRTIIIYGMFPNYTFNGSTEYVNATLYVTDDDGLITEYHFELFVGNPTEISAMFILYLIILFIIGFAIIFILKKVKDAGKLDDISTNKKQNKEMKK